MGKTITKKYIVFRSPRECLLSGVTHFQGSFDEYEDALDFAEDVNSYQIYDTYIGKLVTPEEVYNGWY